MGNLLKLLQEEITNPSDKFNENNSSKESSYLCMAGYESLQGRIGDTENSEEEGKPAQRRAKESRKEAVSGNDTQQKSIESTEVANISEASGNTDSNDSTNQEKLQLIDEMIISNGLDELLNLIESSATTPDSTGVLEKIKIRPPEETSDLPRNSGIDIVMPKKLSDWPDNIKYGLTETGRRTQS